MDAIPGLRRSQLDHEIDDAAWRGVLLPKDSAPDTVIDGSIELAAKRRRILTRIRPHGRQLTDPLGEQVRKFAIK